MRLEAQSFTGEAYFSFFPSEVKIWRPGLVFVLLIQVTRRFGFPETPLFFFARGFSAVDKSTKFDVSDFAASQEDR